MKTISLAISPCPNDTFIFDAIIHQKIDTRGLNIELHFADVEELNQSALKAKYDVTKLSYHAYAYVNNDYVLLSSGSALGNNCGPILIAKEPLSDEYIKESTIGIPGNLTTANLLFSIKYPNHTYRKYMLFSDIENAILADIIPAGVIIHENRFTYQQKGLHKLVDLGAYWEEQFNVPIPLGGIAIKRTIPSEVKNQINSLIRQSIEYAFTHPESSWGFVKQWAQELSDDAINKHINLYVNKYSIELGEDGKTAVEQLYQHSSLKNIIKKPLFV